MTYTLARHMNPWDPTSRRPHRILPRVRGVAAPFLPSSTGTSGTDWAELHAGVLVKVRTSCANQRQGARSAPAPLPSRAGNCGGSQDSTSTLHRRRRTPAPAHNYPGVWPWTDHAEGQASLAGRSRHNTEPYAWQPCPRMAAQGLQPESTTQVIRRTTLLVSERPLQDGHQKGISCTAPRGEIRGGAVFCSPPDSESLKPQIRAGEGRYPHGQARLFIARWGGPSRRSTGTSTRRPCSRQQTRSRTRKPRPARDLSRAGLCRTTYPASASLNGVWT